MHIKPQNKLLKPSPDRIDSSDGDYGPKNFQLAHLACNLGKNNATTAELDLLRLFDAESKAATCVDPGTAVSAKEAPLFDSL